MLQIKLLQPEPTFPDELGARRREMGAAHHFCEQAAHTPKTTALHNISSTMESGDGALCRRCQHPGCDVRLLGCGCFLHARCTPLSLVLDVGTNPQQPYGAFPPPNTVKSQACPICNVGCVEGISLLPLTFEYLEQAAQVRRRETSGDSSNYIQQKTDSDDKANEDLADASCMLLSKKGSAGTEREQHRTGRWTDEETAYVDYLVSAFDQGKLSLPHGIKLNEFLGEMLFCKSSRLTKKMKNAKLSTRSFDLGRASQNPAVIDHRQLSMLQGKFIQSITSESMQLELRFNMMKHWRTHFSNLCVQVGYPYLEAREWIASLEELERRATNAEEIVRKNRRKRMSITLQNDGGAAASSNVYIGGVQADTVTSQSMPAISSLPNENGGSRRLSNSDEGSEGDEDQDDDMMLMLEAFNENNDDARELAVRKRPRTRTLSDDFFMSTMSTRKDSGEDFDFVLRDLIETEPDVPANSDISKQSSSKPKPKPPSHSCGPFLDAITTFMEARNLPFEYADVWVPSFLQRDSKGPSKAVDTEQLRLFHAGYSTRRDLDSSVARHFHEFGDYSDSFTFEPGHGLPGRVYLSGEFSWDCGIDEADPKQFERVGGAKMYGVKTAVGIPLNTPMVGRIVVALYSRNHVPENKSIAEACAAELRKYSPEPKWKLVIEMNNDPNKSPSSKGNVPSSREGVSINVPSLSTQGVGCASPSGTITPAVDPEEQRIVTLLGEHMPLSDGSTGEPTSSAGGSGNLLQHFMSMRLLLLRSSSRRTKQENEMIDILKSSFRAYSRDNRRSGAELASLLAKDWVCLKQTFSVQKNSSARSSQNDLMTRNTSMGSISTRRGSMESAISQTHAHLSQGSFIGQRPGPMPIPPSQIMVQPTPIGPYHHNAMGNRTQRRSSGFPPSSQSQLQPQQVLLSRPQDYLNGNM